jgi:hypothetical protein
MKEWKNPEIMILGIEETKGGGTTIIPDGGTHTEENGDISLDTQS